MRKFVIFFAFMFLGIAYGANVTVTQTPITLDTYTNTGDRLIMLNLSFNLSGIENTTINYIDVSYNSTYGINASSSLLKVCSYNSSLVQLGCNNTWTNNKTSVPLNYKITNQSVENILIGLDLTGNVETPNNVSISILQNVSIHLSNSSILVLGTFPISSEFTEIHDLHATAYVSPRYVDTNVKGQSLIFVLNSTGDDNLTNFTLYMPVDFNITDVVYTVSHDTGTASGECGSSGACLFNSTTNIVKFSVTTLGASDINYLKLNITMNTNSSGDFTRTFRGEISNLYFPNVSIDEKTSGSLNVTTKQLLQVVNQSIMKGSALVNGTDYWLFNITFNLTAPVNGTFQFKMSNWTRWTRPDTNISIPLVNGSGYYYAWIGTNLTGIRAQGVSNKTTSSDRTYITNDYGSESHGLSISGKNLFTIFVKMIIPNNPKKYCCYADWFASFSALFRSTP